MLKVVFSLIAIAIVGWYFWPNSGSESRGPTTRGDIADRDAASEVARCAKQYSDPAMWPQCLEIVVEQTGRNSDNVARQVNRQEGRTIFAVSQ